ncbi:MAG: hypothetical protein PHG91_06725 [Syntrophales bacterium]|nr:hypothetical protein [Syntrophales bacterium]
MARAYEAFYDCRCILFDQKLPAPGMLRNLKKEFLRRELWVPIGEINHKEWTHLINLYGKERFEKLNIDIRSTKLYRAVGCTECDGLGYKGRMGIHELILRTCIK